MKAWGIVSLLPSTDSRSSGHTGTTPTRGHEDVGLHVSRVSMPGCSGMTLVECVIASCILLLTVTAGLTAVNTARRFGHFADDRMNKVHVAREAMETVRLYSYDDAALSDGAHTLTSEIRYTVTTTTNVLYPATKDIAVTVSWKEAGSRGILHTYTLYGSVAECLHRGDA